MTGLPEDLPTEPEDPRDYVPASPLPLLPAVTAAAPLDRSRHLLGFASEVLPDEVEALAVSRFPGAHWDVAPEGIDLISAPGRWARPGEPGVLRLTASTVLVGPYAPQFTDGFGTGLPDRTAYVFDVTCARDRGEPPYPGSGDRDGLGRAFPVGLPTGEEGIVVDWLVAAARRLAGAIRVDLGGAVSPDVTLVPDPDANVDLTLFTDVWLEPEAAQTLLRQVEPSAHLATTGVEWAGPPQIAYDPAALGIGELSEDQVRAVQHAADEVDMAFLSQPMTLEGYAVLVDLGPDGVVAVEVGAEPIVPLALEGLPWTAGGALAYHVRWEAPDLEASQREEPPLAHVLSRTRALGVVGEIAAALQHAVGGEVADEDGFLVGVADLEQEAE
ncbi:hypothetical protein GCM10025864_20680 [Luteimicrobium album]|uniref:Uncharacterized protein n=1 Tax=Luteimicrobium album TaxID=1054550 RepID=A0ABQ6I0P1_9MICO|nr:hypothetical protein GCM10025864_20680 [Luteimicrobium album]